jgi:hypothetical protein
VIYASLRSVLNVVMFILGNVTFNVNCWTVESTGVGVVTWLVVKSLEVASGVEVYTGVLYTGVLDGYASIVVVFVMGFSVVGTVQLSI